MRAPIQLAIAGFENTSGTQCNYTRLALCNDDTMWQMDNTEGVWSELPPIPQHTDTLATKEQPTPPSESVPSGTPETDAETQWVTHGGFAVRAVFARRLETERNAALKRAEEAGRELAETGEAWTQLGAAFPRIELECDTQVAAAQFIIGEYEALAQHRAEWQRQLDAFPAEIAKWEELVKEQMATLDSLQAKARRLETQLADVTVERDELYEDWQRAVNNGIDLLGKIQVAVGERDEARKELADFHNLVDSLTPQP